MKKILLVDIDGTICTDIKNEDSHLYATAEVIEGSLNQLNNWYDEQYYSELNKVFEIINEQEEDEMTFENNYLIKFID